MPIREKAQLMSAAEIDRTLVRLAHEIVERNAGVSRVALVGIRRRGVPISQRLAARIEEIEKVKIPQGTLEVTLYRDDLSTVGPQPMVKEAPLGFPIDDKTVIMVDDVLYTGRTTRAALNALFEHGRPARVQLCVLIDRGWRELPIEASYVGRHVQTAANEIIEVRLREVDAEERVILVEKVPD